MPQCKANARPDKEKGLIILNTIGSFSCRVILQKKLETTVKKMSK